MTAANAAEHEAWNGDSGTRWAASADQRDQVLAPVADAILAAARPSSGEAVVDIGCGCGATSMAAAEAVGPDGAVLGIDLSVPMLEVARRRASAADVTNVSFAADDAQTRSFDLGSTDLVISRFGTMFFSDPAAAFANLGSALAAGGRLCIATWQPLIANEWLTVPGAALLAHADLPPAAAGGPGMFAQADPTHVRATLEDAGFTDVDAAAVEVMFTLGRTVDEAADYLAESGPGRALLETIVDDAVRTEAMAAVRGVLAPHAGPSGVQLRGGILVTTASWPASG